MAARYMLLLLLAATPSVVVGAARHPPGWNGLARTPPLGWRSWNVFGGPQNNQPSINQSLIVHIIDQMIKKYAIRNANGEILSVSLCDLGFCSVGIDEGWERCSGCGSLDCGNNSYCQIESNYCTQHDQEGYPQINSQFPDMKGLVAYAHSKNISMGWYMAGCKCWDKDERPIDYAGDVKAMVDFGFDGVKFDACARGQQNLSVYADHMLAAGKSFAMEQCHWGGGPVVTETPTGLEIDCPFNWWRSSGDITHTFDSIVANLQSVRGGPTFISQPHCWAYPDMLEVGNLASQAEDIAHYSAWAIVSSPLILGMDVTNETIVRRILPILANLEVLEINQQWAGKAGSLMVNHARDSNETFVWAMPCESGEPPVNQTGWLLRDVPGHIVNHDIGYRTVRIQGGESGLCVDFAGSFGNVAMMTPCGSSVDDALGQLLLFTANGSLTQGGQCVDLSGGSGPLASLGRCLGPGALNQQFTFESTGIWQDKGNGLDPYPARCMTRKLGSPRGSATSDIIWQIWAKPIPGGATAIFVLNVGAPGLRAQIEFVDVNMSSSSLYKARDIHAQTDLPGLHMKAFTTPQLEPHSSLLLLFTPEDPQLIL